MGTCARDGAAAAGTVNDVLGGASGCPPRETGSTAWPAPHTDARGGGAKRPKPSAPAASVGLTASWVVGRWAQAQPAPSRMRGGCDSHCRSPGRRGLTTPDEAHPHVTSYASSRANRKVRTSFHPRGPRARQLQRDPAPRQRQLRLPEFLPPAALEAHPRLFAETCRAGTATLPQVALPCLRRFVCLQEPCSHENQSI